MAADELTTFRLEIEGIGEAAEAEEKRAGAGSFGYVFQVTVGGVQRIAKKLHSNFTNPSEVSARERESITSKFRNECVILSKLRHPNIVQFIGVQYGRRGKADLTLIMECVSSDMDKFLEVNPNITLPVKLSILLDVSYGLVYLHERNPPIVHRDLTARNILITDKCQAKIADLGVAKVVDIRAQMAAVHTQTPGQTFYMPPETLRRDASCTPKLDIFSFGHLSLYTVNQEFPQVDDVSQTVTPAMQKQGEVERAKRQKAIDRVKKDHCLYRIIMDCLHDNPEKRPTTRAINSGLIDLSRQNEEEKYDRLKEEIDMMDKQCDQLRVELDGVRMEWKAESELRQKQEEEHQEIMQALQQQMNEDSALLKEEIDIIKAEWNKVAKMYEDQKRKYQAELETLQGEYQHTEGQLRGRQEQLQRLHGENQHVKEQLITEKLKNEKLQASMKHEFENKLHEITQQFSGEKYALASKLGALEQQRKHDYAEWMADRRRLESAIDDTSKLSDEVMTLEQQLKHEKARIRHLEQLSKKKEEEHKEEAEIVRAQCEIDKMEQERLMIILKRELDQLRSQTFGDGQHSDTFRRMEAEGREARNELEILRGKYDGIMDGFTVARDLLIKHNIPFPKCGDQPTIVQPIIMDETQVSAQPHQNMDPIVRPYVEPPPQLLPPSGDPRNQSSSNVGAAGGFHRLSDIDARKHAFSSTQRGISDRPPLDNYSSDPYGADQQNLVSQNLLNKAGYNKPGGYPEKPVTPNLAAPEQRFQAPVLRAQGEGGVIQGRAPYSQHAYDQRLHPPVSEAPSSQPYQQPRYTPPQPRLPQGQQAMVNAPQPQHAPPGHGRPQHAPHGHAPQPQHAPPGHGDAPQGMPYPPTSTQGRRPPNPSAAQENYLVKGIDAEIAEAAAEVQHYQQPRYPPPQPRLPQGQQVMMNAPQPKHAPHGHGHAPQPQHAPPVHGDAPQGMPYPPSSTQGKHPPNPSANFLVKGIDAEIAEAAAGVRQEVTLESMVPAAEAWPLDSNLICPRCKKQYRIGQIQYYKQHVARCEGEGSASNTLQDLPPNEVDLDQDIKRVLSEVKRGMAVSNMTSSGPQSSRPLDSNLVCPKCKKQYRIGQIQYFRRHVDKCEG